MPHFELSTDPKYCSSISRIFPNYVMLHRHVAHAISKVPPGSIAMLHYHLTAAEAVKVASAARLLRACRPGSTSSGASRAANTLGRAEPRAVDGNRTSDSETDTPNMIRVRPSSRMHILLFASLCVTGIM